MSVLDEILAANDSYAASFDKGDLPPRPARRLAVVTCMDARIDPAKALGLAEGDAHVIRNAGGLVTDDALRSLVVSHWLLQTEHAVVVGHTGCGMQTFTNDELRGRLAYETGARTSDVDFHPFTDLEESVRSSVRRIGDSPLLPDAFTATGFVYDIRSGRLQEVTR
jgi:carbonic anhydrase